MLAPLRCSCVPECAGWIRGVNVSVQWKIIGQSIHPAQIVQPSAGTATCNAVCMALSAERRKCHLHRQCNPAGRVHPVATVHKALQAVYSIQSIHTSSLHTTDTLHGQRAEFAPEVRQRFINFCLQQLIYDSIAIWCEVQAVIQAFPPVLAPLDVCPQVQHRNAHVCSQLPDCSSVSPCRGIGPLREVCGLRNPLLLHHYARVFRPHQPSLTGILLLIHYRCMGCALLDDAVDSITCKIEPEKGAMVRPASQQDGP